MSDEELEETISEVKSPDTEPIDEPVEEVEYDGPDGEFGFADDAEIDDFEVDDTDDEWGV